MLPVIKLKNHGGTEESFVPSTVGVYNGPANTLSVTHTLKLTSPVPDKRKGVQARKKWSSKITRTSPLNELPDVGLTSDIIVEVTTSVPTAADVALMRDGLAEIASFIMSDTYVDYITNGGN